MPVDVVGFGEAMIRLTPPAFRRLEQAYSLDVEIGGAELNTLSGLTRLGRSTCWVSRLTDNPLGRLLANRVREIGVEVGHVRFTPEDRVGLYFLECGASPRASSVWYDRKDSAMARIQPGEIDWSAIFTGVKWFHLTGITPALSPNAAEVSRQALQAARQAGVRISLDLNYRSKLWSIAQASSWFRECVPLCDVLIASKEDVATMFGIVGGSAEEVARLTAEHFGLQVVAFSLREQPLVWRNSFSAIAYARGTLYRTRSYEVEIVDRLGAGDAFDAGLIHGLLDDDVQKGLDYGTAAGALKHSIPGDLGWFTREEVEALVQGSGVRIRR